MAGARLAAALLALGLVAAGTAAGTGAGTGAGAGPDGELAISARPAGDYVAIRQRPLFSPDRMPPSLAEPEAVVEEEVVVRLPPPEPPAAALPPNWELIGLVRSERLNSATFRKAGSPVSFNLRKGETRDGWTLAEIGRFEVFIDNGEGRARIGFPGP